METLPQLISEKIKLRQLQPSDFSSLIRHANNQKIADNILNISFPYTEDNAKSRFQFIKEAFEKKDRFIFAMASLATNEVIGEIGLHLDKANNKAEIGYWLGENYWNKGITASAVALILKFGFEEIQLNKIYATHFTDNPASGKVLLKNKMNLEGELKDHYLNKGIYKTVYTYGITLRKYKKSKN
ncbi:MAG: GNAT family N-acetyltransferase [Sphingobacteriaceae bacterium]|nr:GNAT family N-acetyltransferase [Sphingobacteriaceae bacterium]